MVHWLALIIFCCSLTPLSPFRILLYCFTLSATVQNPLSRQLRVASVFGDRQLVMTTSSRALSKLPMSVAGIARTQPQTVSRLLTQPSRRSIATRPALSTKPTTVARQFRRGYADEAAITPTPKKPRRFRVWRWSWRLLNLSLVGGMAYVGYGIYQDRHPEPQIEVDPSKKTLVVLGKPGTTLRPALSRCPFP